VVLSNSPNRKTTILDVGFGCGDQTSYLTTLSQPTPEGNPKLVFDRYIGVTLDRQQYDYASSRLPSSSKLIIHKGDGAKPETWSRHSEYSVEDMLYLRDEKIEEKDVDGWVLALDTLYHFSPSREPLLTFARKDLKASILAFDLLVSDEVPVFTPILLCILAVLMGCPYNTFKTEVEYKSLLVNSGFEECKIEMRDISKEVFSPLSRFLEERDRELHMFGWGLGKLKPAMWLFRWWARSGVVRGMIIVARS
jgi:hypothetical protein